MDELNTSSIAKIEEIVDNAMKSYLDDQAHMYSGRLTIEEYETQTKKRFRRTKDQIKRNLSREEAFYEFLAQR